MTTTPPRHVQSSEMAAATGSRHALGLYILTNDYLQVDYAYEMTTGSLVWRPLVPLNLQTQPNQRPPMPLTPPPGHVPQPKTARTTNQDLRHIICVWSPWYFLLFFSFLFAILIIYQTTCTGTTTTNGTTTTTQGARVRDSRGGWQQEGLETWHISGPSVFFFLYAQIPIYLYSTFFITSDN